MQTFFYDKQIRRLLTQFIRMFSNFQVQYGDNTLRTVPVKYGDLTRMVASIIRDNSENKLISAPMMSCYIQNMEYNRDWVQEPFHIDKIPVRQRNYNEDTGELTTSQGNAFTVERLMPVPYTITMNLDIWTSNSEQKLQLLEQILVLFNPALELQTTDNYLDWTSLTRVELTATQWTNRAIPQGTEDQFDVATLTFQVPFWLTPPAKVKKLGVINKIVASVYDESGDIDDGVIDQGLLMGTRQRFTPQDYGIVILNGQVQLLENYQTTTAGNDSLDVPEKIGTDTQTWKSIINQYGEFQNGISQLRLIQSDDSEVIGTITLHPTDDFLLLFNVDSDTTPTNTLDPLTAIIDPLSNGPSSGLSAAAHNQRYLIINDIGHSDNTDGAAAWKGTDGSDLVASANDIIEYNGTKWIVSFDASEISTSQFVANTKTGIQYKWNGSQWLKSYEGEYKAGEWYLVI